jgi:hypothetical protein
VGEGETVSLSCQVSANPRPAAAVWYRASGKYLVTFMVRQRTVSRDACFLYRSQSWFLIHEFTEFEIGFTIEYRVVRTQRFAIAVAKSFLVRKF